MATITTPVEGFSGISAGVTFTDGKGETTDPAALAFFARQGYGIKYTDDELEVDPEYTVEDPEGDPADPKDPEGDKSEEPGGKDPAEPEHEPEPETKPEAKPEAKPKGKPSVKPVKSE